MYSSHLTCGTKGQSTCRPMYDMSEYLNVINQAILINKTCSNFLFFLTFITTRRPGLNKKFLDSLLQVDE